MLEEWVWVYQFCVYLMPHMRHTGTRPRFFPAQERWERKLRQLGRREGLPMKEHDVDLSRGNRERASTGRATSTRKGQQGLRACRYCRL